MVLKRVAIGVRVVDRTSRGSTAAPFIVVAGAVVSVGVLTTPSPVVRSIIVVAVVSTPSTVQIVVAGIVTATPCVVVVVIVAPFVGAGVVVVVVVVGVVVAVPGRRGRVVGFVLELESLF